MTEGPVGRSLAGLNEERQWEDEENLLEGANSRI